MVKTEIIENIKKEFKAELERREYEYSDSAIDVIFDEFLERKAALIELLSKDPNWDEEKLMIRFDSEYTRRLNIGECRTFADWVHNALRRAGKYTVADAEALDFITYKIRDQFFEEGMADDVDRLNAIFPELKLRKNEKSTKAILKMAKFFGWDKIAETYTANDGCKKLEFNRRYSSLCDQMNPIKVNRHTCISLNPLDYLLMSHGDSWASCHYIDYATDDPGCYSSGTISYMLDETSLIFYTVDKNYDGNEIELQPKCTRQVFSYAGEAFMQSRLYPQANDTGADAVYTEIRNLVQKTLADCLEKPNLWVKSRNKVREIVEHGKYATCYPDWNYNNLCTVSYLKENSGNFKKIVVGAQPICISCGDRHRVDGNIDCCNHYSYHCEDCGRGLGENDGYWVGDCVYCEDCVTYCEYCGEYEVNDRCTYVPSVEEYVCEFCLGEKFTRCKECGEYFENDEMRWDEYNRVNICPDCFEEYYVQCDKCGEWRDRRDDDMHFDKAKRVWVCEDCVEEEEE